LEGYHRNACISFWKPEGNRLFAKPKKEGKIILKRCERVS
jgi:hypothetical protein